MRSVSTTVPSWVLRGGITGAETAVLDFDFQNNRYWQAPPVYGREPSSLLTITRGATGYIDDTTGTWIAVPSNILRVTNKGALIEEASTNSLRNNSMQGAVAGTPGTLPTNWSVSNVDGLTTNVIGTGTSLGIDYIDIQITGTPSGTAYAFITEGQNRIAAASGQTWTNSNFLAIVGGSTTNVSALTVRVRGFQADGTTTTEASAGTDYKATLTAALVRFPQTVTLANALTAFVTNQLLITTVIGNAINITIRIGWPQLEQKAYATSPIRTTSAATTRSADLVSVTKVPSLGTAYTLYGRATPNAPTAFANPQTVVTINDNSANNRVLIRRAGSTGNPNIFMNSGGVSAFNVDIGVAAWAQSSSKSIALTATAGDQIGAFNGTLSAAQSGASMPVGVSTIQIGHSTGGVLWDGYIERIALWPSRRLPNARLQNITT